MIEESMPEHTLETFAEGQLKLAAYFSIAPHAVRLRGMEPCSFVYFCQSENGGPIKIGVSDNPWRRLAAIQLCNPEPLRFVGLVPGNRFDEHDLHERFDSAWVRGEWFRPVPELLEFIAAEASARTWEQFPCVVEPGEYMPLAPREMMRRAILHCRAHDQSVAARAA